MTLVLVVDDDLNAGPLYAKYMRQPGLELCWATSCGAAFEWLKTLIPDVLILDMNLPDGNGLSVVDYCQADARFATTQIVVVSANDQFRPTVVQRGIEYFLCKPVSVSMLARLVRRLTGLRGESTRVRSLGSA